MLDRWSAGDQEAIHRLIPLVIEDLRGLARGFLARERPGHTLQPTALVNEVYLRLAGRRKVELANRVQLFSVLAESMRRILVDHARRKNAARRGSGMPKVAFEEVLGQPDESDVDLVALDDALRDLARLAPRQAEMVHLSYFGGLTHGEIGTALETSESTVRRELRSARLWLLRELGTGRPAGDGG
ncbi:MAG: ECF-type sigma factor [Holophagales bacterium]|nr:ECF-type sigma factor [Holophagales bacterium]